MTAEIFVRPDHELWCFARGVSLGFVAREPSVPVAPAGGAAPAGGVRVVKLYEDGAALERS